MIVTFVSTSGEARRLFIILHVYWRHNAELIKLKKRVTVIYVYIHVTLYRNRFLFK